ncbi:MAG: serine hydrolase domain-containing protein [Gemmatimonadales bacterium]
MRAMLGLAVGAAAAMLGAQGAVAQRPAPNAGPAWDGFVQAFETYARAQGVVGASAALVSDGRIAARRHFGLADRATGKPVDDRTILHWGSITKTQTAIAVMQLRDRKQLSLDDPIVRWLPELRRVHDPYGTMGQISLRMLLSHTAGFRNGTWPYGDGSSWQPFEPTDWSQLVAMMPYQQLLFEPGSRYSYSNPGFIYLARVIEQESHDPWAVYIQKNIWTPLGMTRSYVGFTPYHLVADRGHGYVVTRPRGASTDSTEDVGAEFDPGITIPNGGWNAPIDDVAAYANFLLGRPADAAAKARYEGVLTRVSLEEMWQPVLSSAEGYTAGESVGLSFFLMQRSGRRVVGHTGGQGGYQSFLYLDPSTGKAIIANFNTTNEARPDRAAWNRLVQAALATLD